MGINTLLQAIPSMIKKVWPGAWFIFVGVTLAVYLSDPGLKFLTPDEFLTSHILIVLGLLALTVTVYNTLSRMQAAIATISIWLIVAGLCYLAEAVLRVAAH